MRIRTVAALACACALGACSDPAPAPGPSASVSAPQPSASASETASAFVVPPASTEIRPVYPIDKSPPEPIAQRYCDAVHKLPAERRAACCSEDASMPTHPECVRTLSAAVRSKAVVVDDAALGRCEEAMKALHDGCDWVGLASPSMPEACLTVLGGSLEAKATCRSSLECKTGLRCYGLGATQPGVCAPPRPKDAICGTGADTLAPLTRQETFEESHPECEGFCMQRRCQAALAPGSACKGAYECGRNRSCVEGKCADKPLPTEGSACASNECSHGLRCIESKCQKPNPAGAACKADSDCQGGCENGKCTKRCKVSLKDIPKK